MFSIRNPSANQSRRLLAILALAGIAPVLGGCNLKYRRPIEAANDPKTTDDANTKRNWPQQEALYANSTLEAYKQRFPYNYDAIAQQRREQAIVAAPLALVVQTIVLPFTFIKNPPGTKQTYSTLQQEPSYTVMPSRPELATDVVRGGSETGSQFPNQQNGQLNNGNNAPSGDNLLGNRPAGQQTPQGQTPANPLPRNNTGAPNNNSSANPNAPSGQGGNSVPNPITPPGPAGGGTGTGTGGTGTGGSGSGGSGGGSGGGGAGGR